MVAALSANTACVTVSGGSLAGRLAIDPDTGIGGTIGIDLDLASVSGRSAPPAQAVPKPAAQPSVPPDATAVGTPAGPGRRAVSAGRPAYFEASNLRYELAGKIRDRPADPDILAPLAEIAAQAGLGMIVVSGGQDAIGKGTRRTGSTRHDIDAHGNGQAVDVTLTREGKRLTPDIDPAVHAAFIEAAAALFPGIGHYPWGLHVGRGTEAFWGPDRTAKSADPALLQAFRRGRALSKR